MRYCPYCRRLNSGSPVICNYCGRTWYIRLCPRGHENPSNAQFCGTCGSVDLSETAGPRPWAIYPLKILVIVILVMGIFLLMESLFRSLAIIVVCLLPIVLLLAGYTVASSILPQPVKKIASKMNKLLLKWATSLAIWCLETGKEFLKLIIKW